MNTIFALYIWTVVGAGHGEAAIRKDWRNVGEFSSEQRCNDAARQLGIKTDLYRCVDTGRI